MKKVKITLTKNYKDSKFSYPNVKRNKKGNINEEQNQENKENISPNSIDFWDDCRK
jgi:hypothetical protein